MTLVRVLLGSLVVVITASIGLYHYAINTYTTPPVNPDWQLSAAEQSSEDSISVRFSGTSTLLFDDGETQWMVDGWFSRPTPMQLLLGGVTPNMTAIDYGLQANKVTKLAAIFPMHSHYDHAMDSPEVAKRTGALLLGSESTANIGRGWGLSEAQIKVVENRQSFNLGKFIITPIESKHFEFPNPKLRERALGNPAITEPLIPPVKAFDYRLGKAYVLHVAHPKGNWIIVGSAGYEEGILDGFQADTVFLGIGGIGTQTPEYRESFWQDTVGSINPQRIIPIHFDSLIAPITDPLRGASLAENFMSGGAEVTRRFLDDKADAQKSVKFATLPKFKKVVLYD
jgi:L-ascorbate metabolism protein UlaG (beta-lactamase superfamily)